MEQILDKAHIAHQRLSLNALEGDLPSGIQASDIYKTLALIGDKTGPLIGIIPLTEHLSEKQLAKVSGNKKVSMIPKKRLAKDNWLRSRGKQSCWDSSKAFLSYFY